MIKLIASDLDGTLLYGRDNTVSEEMFEMIKEMKQKGILFAAASGRQYHNVKNLFAPVWEDMAFICENGAVVFYKDQIIARQEVPMEQLLELAEIVDADEQTEVALSSPATTYVRPKNPEYARFLEEFGNHVTIVKEWAEVTEPCVKLAWYEKNGAEKRLDYWKDKIKPPAKVVTSGAQWLDILYPNSHKGVGIEALQKQFGFGREEMAAFGDNGNDMEMLAAVAYPIAMNSGKEGIIKFCSYHTDRVEDTVRRILDGEFPDNS